MDKVAKIQTNNKVIRLELAALEDKKKQIARKQNFLNQEIEKKQRIFDMRGKRQKLGRQKLIEESKRKIQDLNKKRKEVDLSLGKINSDWLKQKEIVRKTKKQKEVTERELKVVDSQIRQNELLLKQRESTEQREQNREKEMLKREVHQREVESDRLERRMKEVEKDIMVQKARLRQGLSQFRQAMEDKAHQKIK